MIMKMGKEDYDSLSKKMIVAVQQEPSLSPVQDQPEDLSIKKVINIIINTTTNTNLEPKSNLHNHHDENPTNPQEQEESEAGVSPRPSSASPNTR